MMKLELIAGLALFSVWAISSELEYRDHINIQRAHYEHCIDIGSQLVYTDSDVDRLIATCEAQTK